MALLGNVWVKLGIDSVEQLRTEMPNKKATALGGIVSFIWF